MLQNATVVDKENVGNCGPRLILSTKDAIATSISQKTSMRSKVLGVLTPSKSMSNLVISAATKPVNHVKKTRKPLVPGRLTLNHTSSAVKSAPRTNLSACENEGLSQHQLPTCTPARMSEDQARLACPDTVMEGGGFRAESSTVKAKRPSNVAPPSTASKRGLSLAKPTGGSRTTQDRLMANAAMPPMQMLFDEKWKEKQEACFGEWMNFMFQDDIAVSQDSETNLETFYRAVSRRRKDDRARWRVASVWESAEIRPTLFKLDKEVKEGRLRMRTDRQCHTDVGMRDYLLQILLTVNTVWLRPVLEVVYNQAIPRLHPSDSVNLHRFLTSRLTKNPELLARFQINVTSSELNTSPGFYKELNQFILLKVLHIILLLDRCKLGKVLDGNPCLFNTANTTPSPHGVLKLLKTKSTKDMVANFSKEFLSGEGDVLRHLNFLGMAVTFQQKALDEYDFRVTNLASDLRDGVRLSHMVEILCDCKDSLRPKLRVPAISRLQKVHNVNLAVEFLKSYGVGSDDANLSRDIVDGHREQTLGVLWMLLSRFKLPDLVSPATLKEEIARISLARKTQTAGKTEPLGDDVVGLLLRWCQTVCESYGQPIHNFTTSIGDGKALCYLINFYVPDLLPLEEVQHTRADMAQSMAFENDCDDKDLGARYGSWAQQSMLDHTSQEYTTAVKGEADNLKLAVSKAQELGGVPYVIRLMDLVNSLPEEKTVVTFVAYLSARLIELGKEVQAALILQKFWRNAQQLAEARKYEGVVTLLQRNVRMFLARCRRAAALKAVVKIQSAWRSSRYVKEYRQTLRRIVTVQNVFRQRKAVQIAHEEAEIRVILSSVLSAAHARRNHMLARHTNASLLQAVWLGYRQRSSFAQIRHACLSIQSLFIGRKARLYCRDLRMAIRIQKVYKGMVQRREFQKVLANIKTVQRIFRGRCVRRDIVRQNTAAIRIQCRFRCFAQTRKFRTIRASVCNFQAQWRCFRQMRVFQRKKTAAISVQSLWRGHQKRCEVKRIRAAIRIQAVYKGHRQVVLYKKTVRSAIALQNLARGMKVRTKISIQRSAAKLVQSCFRAFSQRKAFVRARFCIVRLQAQWRSYMLQADYSKIKAAALVFQTQWRGRSARMFCTQIHSAVQIQKFYKGYRQLRAHQVLRRSAICVQASFKAFMQRKAYAHTRLCFTKLQAQWRGFHQRSLFKTMKKATVMVQAMWRGRMDRHHCACIRSAIRIQASWKGHSQLQKFQRMKAAAVRVQASCSALSQTRAYRKTRHSLVHLQAFWRGWSARAEYSRTLAKIVRIQSVARGKMVRQTCAKMSRAGTQIQSWWRARAAERAYAVALRRVVMVQSLMRRHLATSEVAEMRTTRLVLGNVLSAAHIRRDYVLLRHNNARKIQAVWRGYHQSKAFAQIRHAALSLQAHFRGRQARRYCKDVRMVVRIQKVYKGMLQRRVYHKILADITTIQRIMRGHSARQLARKARVARRQTLAATAVQSVYRGWVVRQQLVEWNSAALRMQSWWRARAGERAYAVSLKRVVVVQSLVRRHLAKSAVSEIRTIRLVLSNVLSTAHAKRDCMLERHKSASRLQALWLGYRQRVSFTQTKRAVLSMQSHFRGKQARLYCRDMRMAVRIQKVFKGMVQRREYQQTVVAIVDVQRVFRGHCSRQLSAELRRVVVASVRLQSWWRCCTAVRSLHLARCGAVRLQAWWRGHSARKAFCAVVSSTITAQRLCRGFVTRRRLLFQRLTSQTVRIQSQWRRHVEQRAYSRTLKATLMIQTNARTWCAVKAYRCELRRVIRLQAFARGLAARQVTSEMREAMREARKCVCVVRLQSAWHCHTSRRTCAKKAHSIRAIQRLWRGYSERKKLWANCMQLAMKAREMRVRIEAARSRVQEHMKLGNRTSAGLDVLLHSNSITTIMKAVLSLEVATRWSDVCARCIAELGAIERLYSVIKSCNRSKPELELAKMCLLTISNFTSESYHGEFRSCISHESATNILAEFIQNNRDKDEASALQAVALLTYICADPSVSRTCQQTVNRQPSPVQRLNGVLVAMKKKMPKQAGTKRRGAHTLLYEVESLLALLSK